MQYLLYNCIFLLTVLDILIVGRQLIDSGLNPVFIEERITRPQNDPNTNRPVPRVMKTIYSFNTAVNKMDRLWDHPSFRYNALINDSSSFDSAVFQNDSHGDNNDTGSPHSSTMDD